MTRGDGKAIFTVNGGTMYHLVYTKVYARKRVSWKFANLHTCQRRRRRSLPSRSHWAGDRLPTRPALLRVECALRDERFVFEELRQQL